VSRALHVVVLSFSYLLTLLAISQDAVSGKWYDVGHKVAREKVSQALRDALKNRDFALETARNAKVPPHESTRGSGVSLPASGVSASLQASERSMAHVPWSQLSSVTHVKVQMQPSLDAAEPKQQTVQEDGDKKLPATSPSAAGTIPFVKRLETPENRLTVEGVSGDSTEDSNSFDVSASIFDSSPEEGGPGDCSAQGAKSYTEQAATESYWSAVLPRSAEPDPFPSTHLSLGGMLHALQADHAHNGGGTFSSLGLPVGPNQGLAFAPSPATQTSPIDSSTDSSLRPVLNRFALPTDAELYGYDSRLRSPAASTAQSSFGGGLVRHTLPPRFSLPQLISTRRNTEALDEQSVQRQGPGGSSDQAKDDSFSTGKGM
jgi:hypothetical protein